MAENASLNDVSIMISLPLSALLLNVHLKNESKMAYFGIQSNDIIQQEKNKIPHG